MSDRYVVQPAVESRVPLAIWAGRRSMTVCNSEQSASCNGDFLLPCSVTRTIAPHA